MLVFLCSPHRNGATDILGKAAANNAEIIKLPHYKICGCLGCGACLKGNCPLSEDDADLLFKKLAQANSVIFAAPVYFYALPGQFKLFIDRSQKFWKPVIEQSADFQISKKAGVIMVAGRPSGKKLFAGSLLTLKWFLKPFGFMIAKTLLLRGIESPEDLTTNMLGEARFLGQLIAGK